MDCPTTPPPDEHAFRPALHGDVISLARLLLTFGPDFRQRVSAQIIERAMIAELRRRRTGQRHTVFGDGSIDQAARMAAKETMRELPPEPHLSDPDYLDCMICALTAIREAVATTSERMAAE